MEYYQMQIYDRALPSPFRLLQTPGPRNGAWRAVWVVRWGLRAIN